MCCSHKRPTCDYLCPTLTQHETQLTDNLNLQPNTALNKWSYNIYYLKVIRVRCCFNIMPLASKIAVAVRIRIWHIPSKCTPSVTSMPVENGIIYTQHFFYIAHKQYTSQHLHIPLDITGLSCMTLLGTDSLSVQYKLRAIRGLWHLQMWQSDTELILLCMKLKANNTAVFNMNNVVFS